MVAVVDGVCPPTQRRTASGLHRLVAVAVVPAQLVAGSPLAQRLAGPGEVDLLLLTDGDGDGDAEDDPGPRLRALADAMGVPGLVLHRLALPAPVAPRHVDDVVAAISELVGFDPEPGVGCVVPSTARAAADGPADAVLGPAVERIVRVYRLPVLTYPAG